MKKTKCPVCGASQSLVIANCAYCGAEIARVAELKPEEYIAALRTRLEKIEESGKDSFDASEERVRVIQRFTMPSDVECLVEFLTFCDGNSESGDEKEAWFGKARAAYGKLRIAVLNNPQLRDIIKEYEQRYSTEALTRKKKDDDRFMMFSMIIGMPLLAGAAGLMLYGMWLLVKKLLG